MKKIILFSLLFALFSTMNFAQGKNDSSEIMPIPPAPKINANGVDNFYKTFLGGQEKQKLERLDKKTRALLEKIKKYDEEKYNELLFQAQFKNFEIAVPGIKDTYDDNQKIWDLELETEALGLQYQHEKKNKAAIESKLRSKLARLFDLKEEKRKAEVASLEKQLAQLKKALNFRSKNKEQIIQRRMEELTGRSKYLDWDK